MTASTNRHESSVIRIDDKQADGRSILNLAEVLARLPSNFNGLTWAVQDLAVSGVSPSGADVSEVEAQTKQLPSGLILPWDDLVRFAKSITQVQDGVIVGSRDAGHMPPVGADSDVLASYPVVLEAVDSSYWLLHVIDPNVRTRSAQAFRSVHLAYVSDL